MKHATHHLPTVRSRGTTAAATWAEPDQHHKLCELLGYWRSLCRHGRLPHKRDIDPTRIPTLLTHIALLEVAPDVRDCRFILVGKAVNEALGDSLRGKTLKEVDFDHQYEEVFGSTAAVIETKQPNFREATFITRDYRSVHYERLLCPLSADGCSVDWLLLGLVPLPVAAGP